MKVEVFMEPSKKVADILDFSENLWHLMIADFNYQVMNYLRKQ